jgi:hypothetical protein
MSSLIGADWTKIPSRGTHLEVLVDPKCITATTPCEHYVSFPTEGTLEIISAALIAQMFADREVPPLPHYTAASDKAASSSSSSSSLSSLSSSSSSSSLTGHSSLSTSSSSPSVNPSGLSDHLLFRPPFKPAAFAFVKACLSGTIDEVKTLLPTISKADLLHEMNGVCLDNTPHILKLMGTTKEVLELAESLPVTPLRAICWGANSATFSLVARHFVLATNDYDELACHLACAKNGRGVVKKIFKLFNQILDEERLKSCLAAAYLANNEGISKFLNTWTRKFICIADDTKLREVCADVGVKVAEECKEGWQRLIKTKHELKIRKFTDQVESLHYLMVDILLYFALFGGFCTLDGQDD